MNKIQKQRLIWLVVFVMGISIAVALVLYALRDNINLFYTPSQVYAGEAPKAHVFRIGGLVRRGTLKHSAENLTVTFVLTDTAKDIVVSYRGILPDLFREGQGIVALGKMDQQGKFIAQQVLAKHDENYMPPQVGAALQQIKQQHDS